MSFNFKNIIDKSIFYLYIALLFSFTFSIAIRNTFLALLFVLVIIRFFIYRELNIKKNEFNFYIITFLIFTFASFFVANNLELAIDRFVSPILRYIFFFYLTFSILKRKELLNKYFNILLYGNLTFAFLGFLIKFINGNNYMRGNGTGSVAAFNVFIFTALLFNKNENKYKKLFYLFGTISFAYILFQTTSRGAVLGFLTALFVFSGFLIYYNFDSEKFKSIATVILILFILITPFLMPDRLLNKFDNLRNVYENNSLKTRIVMWESSIYMIKNNPMLGVGVGNYQPHYLDYLDNIAEEKLSSSSRKHDHPHNMFLFIAAEQGIPSLVLFLIMIFIAIKVSLFNIYNYEKFSLGNIIGIVSLSMFIVFIVHSMVDSTARYGHVGFYLIFITIINYLLYE
ncbi:MAG: O-antigen ligase family protein, partial [Halanaerobium sp.]